MLEVQQLHAGYGQADVLHGIDLHIPKGSFCALIGANGAGKSTTMKALAGLLRPSRGEVWLEGRKVSQLSAAQVLRQGMALVPEGRRVFGPLSVRENLQMGAFVQLFPRRRADVERPLEFVLNTFPRLRERLDQAAGTLSGGEQQMLAIGRALMSEPHTLLLDEPSMGLAPLVVQQVFQVLNELQRAGLTLLVSEQNAHVALTHADHGYVLEAGRIVKSDAAQALRDNDEVREAYLGI